MRVFIWDITGLSTREMDAPSLARVFNDTSVLMVMSYKKSACTAALFMLFFPKQAS